MLPVNGIRSFTQIIQDNNTLNKTDGNSHFTVKQIEILQTLRSRLAQGKEESQGSALRLPSSRLLFNKSTDF